MDYDLSLSKEGMIRYKELTQKILENPSEIRHGVWKKLGNCDFYINDNNVAIIKDNKWISTFPLTKRGTFEYIMSLPK